MHLVKAADAPRFELPHAQFDGMAAPSRGSKQLCTWRLTVPGNLAVGPAHTLDRDEVFMLLSGRLEISGQLLEPGDALVVPAGDPIALGNPGDEPAVAHVAIPAGFTAEMPDGSRFTPPWAQ
ncbi:cupin domain-containing protein [Nocardia sp. NPDC127579]|uniref:cupin domain-containing protein n=1 Tax=Nocardia sp. NPDC127579 TaxID=3345402 RepID=UPI0036275F35